MNLGAAPRQYDPALEAKLRRDLAQAIEACIQKSAAVGHILMTKPDGTVGKLTIDAGGSPIWTAL